MLQYLFLLGINNTSLSSFTVRLQLFVCSSQMQYWGAKWAFGEHSPPLFSPLTFVDVETSLEAPPSPLLSPLFISTYALTDYLFTLGSWCQINVFKLATSALQGSVEKYKKERSVEPTFFTSNWCSEHWWKPLKVRSTEWGKRQANLQKWESWQGFCPCLLPL